MRRFIQCPQCKKFAAVKRDSKWLCAVCDYSFKAYFVDSKTADFIRNASESDETPSPS